MLTREENDLLVSTGPGTPGGALLRRYWQPVALSEELAENEAPLPVRILGEDLVLFRDDQGRPGLLGLHCSHRRADLSYGRVENGGFVVSITAGSTTFMGIVSNSPASLRTKSFDIRFIIPLILARRWADSSLPIWVPGHLPFCLHTKRSMHLRDTGW